jgi:hypothetical protein
MPATQQREDAKDLAQHQRETLYDLIGERLIHTLGAPDNLLKVQVRQLWDDHYRANVFVGADASSAKVAHSYFLVVDADGNVLSSTPQIAKLY